MKTIRIIAIILLCMPLASYSQGDLDDGVNIQSGIEQLRKWSEELSNLQQANSHFRNATEVLETIRLMETAICGLDDIELLQREVQVLGYGNCFFDFELKASILQIKNAGYLLTTTLQIWEKSSALVKATKVNDALKDFKEAYTEMFNLKAKLQELLRLNKQNIYFDKLNEQKISHKLQLIKL